MKVSKNYILTILFLITFTLLIIKEAWAQKVVLTTSDGYKITGQLIYPNKKTTAGVVLLHIYNSNKESWNSLIPYLTEKGITTLAIDMRGHGESRFGPNDRDESIMVEKRDSALFNQMHMDAEAAVKYLVQKAGIDPKRIGLIGASVGCSVAIHTVSNGAVNIGAVIVMTPGKDYLRVPTMIHLKKWSKTPILILSSKEEASNGADSIYQTLIEQEAPVEIRLFDEKDIHGTYMFGRVKEIEKLIADWMAKKLLR